MARTSILVIDDNEADFELVRDVLPESLALTWCEHASDARVILASERFDLILLDHGLPDTNGLAFLSELMAEDIHCPIIMLTGREDPTLAISALQMGAQNYLVKSEIFDHLVTALEEALSMPLSSDLPASNRFLDTAARFYPRLIETINDGCVVLDREGVVTFANRAGRSYTSFLSGSPLGREVLDMFCPESQAQVRAELARARSSRTPLSSVFEACIGDADTRTPMRVSMHSLHAADRTFENAILVMHDLTEQVRARELRHDLVRAVVHDLRTPLTSIVSAVEMLARMHRDHARSGELLGVIELSAGNMLGMINQILEIEHLEHGTLPITFTISSLESLIRRAIQAQSHLASAKDLTLECSIRSVATDVRMDPELISRVLQNLLANAIRYSPTGETVAVELSQLVGESAEAELMLVSVQDCGPGIDEELIETLFDKFVRGAGGGSGLGLTFCKFAVESHGGEIWFEPAPERGAIFAFTLPSSHSEPD